jgi:hypothetical protein
MAAYRVPRVQLVPLPDDQVSFQADGHEKLRWNSSPRFPRPFFFPLLGPSGRSVLRMGHPAAPDHGHHRALWWGHQNVGSVNFWEERGGGQQIRQDGWVHYQDGAEEAGLVVRLGWYDAHKTRLVQQEMIAVFRPLAKGESWLELQTSFTPVLDKLPLGKTNFGFVGLRVAASMSARYGGGRLTNDQGKGGEGAVVYKPAQWMDYSGPIAGDAWEGVTWFDHPTNPHYPTSWLVRDDGWMSAAYSMREKSFLTKAKPLRLRYGFHVHARAVDARTAEGRRKAFADSAAWEVVAAKPPWRVRLRRARK